MRTHIAKVKALLHGDIVDIDGGLAQILASGGWLPDRPIEVPVYMAGQGPRARALAKEITDGLISLGAPVEGFETCLVSTNGTVLDDGEDVTSPRVSHLRIVDDEQWERVKARQQALQFEIARDARGNALNRAHRRKFLLSGRLVCGACGGGYTIIAPDRYGCATRRSKGTCGNAHAIGLRELEERVLGGLKERMVAPELVETFIKEFTAELRRISGEAERERTSARSALDAIERRVAKIVRAIEDGAYHPSFKARLTALEKESAAIEAKLAGIGNTPVLRLHPNLPALYRSKVEKLTEALGEPGTSTEAGEILRSLIERIVLTPKDGSLRVELHGDLGVLARFADAEPRKSRSPGSHAEPGLLSVVAGARLGRYRHSLAVAI